MYIFANELSFQAQASDVINANQLMDDLITVIKFLKPIQGIDPILTSRILWQQEISHGYNVNQWLFQTNRDKMRWFMAVVRKGPYVEALLDNELSYHECWFCINDVTSSSLAGAVFFDGILTSLQGSPDFSSETVYLKYREGDDDFKCIEKLNVYEPAKVTDIVDRIIQEMLCGVSSWDQLWEQKDVMFPRLSFCDCVRGQLDDLGFTPTNVKIIKEHLTKMNEYCERLDRESIIPDYAKMGVLASEETSVTLSRYGYQRTFLCPDGKERLFEWHTKQIGQNLRIHFYPLYPDSTAILVGYIGPHLNTYSYH